MLRNEFRFSAPVRVRWQECDAQGIAFNGSYLGWLEVAQAEYFRNLASASTASPPPDTSTVR